MKNYVYLVLLVLSATMHAVETLHEPERVLEDVHTEHEIDTIQERYKIVWT